MDREELIELLRDNLRVEVSRGDFIDPNSRTVKLLLEDEVISEASFNVVQKEEYSG